MYLIKVSITSVSMMMRSGPHYVEELLLMTSQYRVLPWAYAHQLVQDVPE